MRAALVLSFLAFSAQASPLELYGVGLKGVARGLANVAGSDDLFATFYNPAGLMDVQSIEFAMVHQINAPFLSIDLNNPESAVLAPAKPDVFQNTTMGFAVPLTGRLRGRAALGAILEIPNGLLLRARALDARRPHWFFYDSYADVFVAQVAFALRLFDGLDLAIGLHNNTGLNGRVKLRLDPVSNRWTQRELDFEFSGKMGPTVGLKGRYKNWCYGLVYRSPLAMDFATPAEVALQGLDAGMLLELSGKSHVLPAVVAAGLQFEQGRLQLELAAEWKDWSNNPDPSLDASIDVGGSDLDGLGLGSALDAPDRDLQPRQSPGFQDVISFGIGASYRWSKAWNSDFGMNYLPSPIPVQLHHTNLVDNDRLQLGASLVWHVQDPFSLFAKPLDFGLAMQWNQLVPQTVNKALGTLDPIGDWRSSGGVLSANFGLSGRI